MADHLLMAAWDGATGDDLASALALSRVVVFESVGSTMDEAAALAASGASSGTLVIADVQTSGRGRGGRTWESLAGDGIWLTLIERIEDPSGLEVLSLRIGLHAARALDRFSSRPVGLKWPNDLFLGGGKLGGILVETRWRGSRADWTAIGVGVNVTAVRHPAGAALGPSVTRREVLEGLVPSLRAAAGTPGRLTTSELAEFAARDVAAGRRCVHPVMGQVLGIAADGALRVVTAAGEVMVREGSLVLEET